MAIVWSIASSFRYVPRVASVRLVTYCTFFLSSFVEAELLALSLSDVSFEYLALLVDFPSAITKRDAENPQISEPIQEKSCQL